MRTSGGPGDWRTPAPLRDKFVREYRVSLDVAAQEHNRVCSQWLKDAFTQSWAPGEQGNRWWANPPYDRILPWVNRAIDQCANHGFEGVMLVPASTDTRWFHMALESGHCRFWLFQGRIKFDPPEGVIASTPNIGNVLIEFSQEYQPHRNPFAGTRLASTGEVLRRTVDEP